MNGGACSASVVGASSERRQLFIDTAREAFFRDGYAATTMSLVAARVGGSKTTLWTYFPSKEKLFAAVVDDIVNGYGDALSIEFSPEEDVGHMLERFGVVLLRTLSSGPILELHRLVIGEAPRFPELAEMFYQRGPSRGKRRLSEWMEAKMDRGEIRRADPMLAARQFVALCQCGSYQKLLFGLRAKEEGNSQAEIAETVASFVRAWTIPAISHAS